MIDDAAAIKRGLAQKERHGSPLDMAVEYVKEVLIRQQFPDRWFNMGMSGFCMIYL